MRAEMRSKLVEVVVIVEKHDMHTLARASTFFPKDGTITETWFDEDDMTYRMRVQAPAEKAKPDAS